MFFQKFFIFFTTLLRLAHFFYGESVHPLLIMKKGKGSIIEPTASFRYSDNIAIGKNTLINHHCLLWAGKKAKIIIGNDVLLGPGVKIFSVNHGTRKNKKIRLQAWEEKDVVIGNNVWIGANTTILCGVEITDDCVIGAGAVVTKSLPAKGVYSGVPAKIHPV